MNLDIAKLDLRPRDTLVVKVNDTHISTETAKRLQEFVRAETGHQRVLILDKALDLSVLAPTSDEATA